MAIIQGPGSGSGTIVHPCSIRGGWIEANSDLETADTANLLKPWNISRAAFNWVQVPQGATRVLLRGRCLVAATINTAAAVVKLWGINGSPNSSGVFSGTGGASGYAECTCLDNADPGATGLSLTFAATGGGLLEDNTYIFTDLPDLTGYDCKGCDYVGMLVATACSLGSSTASGMLKFLN
jgi:hypothetical protein